MQKYQFKRSLLNDKIASKVLSPGGGEAVASEIISVVLHKTIIVKTIQIQKRVQNGLEGRYVVYDCVCEDLDGNIFNVEMQIYHDGNLLQRARFYLDLLTVDSYTKGMEYKDLPGVCVIFICETNPYYPGDPITTIAPYFLERAQVADMRESIVFFSVKDALKSSKNEFVYLAKDLLNENMAGYHSHVIEERVQSVRGDIEDVMKESEYIRKVSLEEGAEAGRVAVMQEIIRRAMSEGLSFEEIAERLFLSPEEIHRWKLVYERESAR